VILLCFESKIYKVHYEVVNNFRYKSLYHLSSCDFQFSRTLHEMLSEKKKKYSSIFYCWLNLQYFVLVFFDSLHARIIKSKMNEFNSFNFSSVFG
jgi:hypothetical protein